MYTYNISNDTLVAKGLSFSTNDWQEALDFWSDTKSKKNITCLIVVVDEDGVETFLSSQERIQEWSDKLKEEMTVASKRNRVERRIAKEFNEYGNYGENNAPLPDFHGKFEEMSEEVQDDIINPAHYKMIPPEAYSKHPQGLEYMDLMEYILANHTGVESHLLGQVFKYACRLGKKDADLQDAKKIEWYANRLVSVIKERS